MLKDLILNLVMTKTLNFMSHSSVRDVIWIQSSVKVHGSGKVYLGSSETVVSTGRRIF